MNKGNILIKILGILFLAIIFFSCNKKVTTYTYIDTISKKLGDLTWDFKDGTLTISGQGAMPNFSVMNDAPWIYGDGSHKNITSVIINEGVTNIGDSALKNLKNVVSISLPLTVTNIGESAFENCTSLTSIIIPDGVINIDDSAFKGCSKLNQIEIPDSVINIGYGAFEGCARLIQIEIPDSTIKIGRNAFIDCTGLINVILGEKLQLIGSDAFFRCENIQTITSKNPIPPVYELNGFFDLQGLFGEDRFFNKCRLIVSDEFTSKYKENNFWRLFFMTSEERSLEFIIRSEEKSKDRIRRGGNFSEGEPFFKAP